MAIEIKEYFGSKPKFVKEDKKSSKKDTASKAPKQMSKQSTKRG